MNIYQKIVLLTSMFIFVSIIPGIIGILKHWNYRTVMKIMIPFLVAYLFIGGFVLLRLPLWFVGLLIFFAIVAYIAYVTGLIRLGEVIRGYFFKK